MARSLAIRFRLWAKDVELVALRQQLDPDTGPRLLPLLFDQMLL
jgi:hypothetical protein